MNVRELVKLYDAVLNGVYYLDGKGEIHHTSSSDSIEINKWGLSVRTGDKCRFLTLDRYGRTWARKKEELK